PELYTLSLHAALPISYVQIAVLAIRRIISVKDFGCLKLILLTPLMYTIGFRGMVETVIGRMRSQNRQELRAIMYSTFKTHFCYRSEEHTSELQSRGHL